MGETVSIPAPGATLTGTLFRAADPGAVAVLNPATGVGQGYYSHFARWLAADRNITCLTYDYRDFGASAHGPVRHSRASMADWGITDQQAARDWLGAHAPDTPLWVIGHSLGGFMLGYQTGLARISRVIALASGPVHVRDHPWPYQASARFFWYLLGPSVMRATGYLPGRLSGLGADLPGPVFAQWKAWCTSRDFHHADASLPPYDPSRLTAPLRSVALADDVMMPPATVARLGTLYPSARQTHVTLDPPAYGLSRVGHLAAFARRNSALWPDILGD